jgi:hypothetical protein
MPELIPEPEHEEVHKDPESRRIGIIASILAVALTIVTITSHRTHTRAIMDKSSANDQWSYYQSTRIKLHSAELGSNLLNALGTRSDAAEKSLKDYEGQRKKYEAQSEENKQKAEAADHAAEADEDRALRFDLGEGLLEIGLVLTSLYFISRKMMFPMMGGVAAILGMAIAATGLFI